MYINFDILQEKGLSPNHLFLLVMIRQNKFEDNAQHIEKERQKYPSNYAELVSHGLVDYIKGTPSQTEEQKVRITKKGQSLLEDLETPEINQDDLKIFDWCVKEYVKREKTIGSKKKIKQYIAKFRVNSGIEKNKLAILLSQFLNDQNNMEYNHVLEYAFFKPPTTYATRFEIEQSRLYQYYLKNQLYFDNQFAKEDAKTFQKV